MLFTTFLTEMCLDIIKEGIGQGGLADGTGHPKCYGCLPWWQGATMEY